jgi:hypothetical protein
LGGGNIALKVEIKMCGLKGGKSKGWKVGLKRRSQGVRDLSSSYKFNNVVCNIILSFIKVIIIELFWFYFHKALEGNE